MDNLSERLKTGAAVLAQLELKRIQNAMTPDDYRQKWGLNADYPMVAPNYAEQRRALAKKIGLGTKRKRTAAKK